MGTTAEGASSTLESDSVRAESEIGRLSQEKHVEKHVSEGVDQPDATPSEATLKDDNIVSWDGPDDPENPMNWKASKKVTTVAIVSLITFLSPLSSSVISPATAEVMETFHSTNATLGAFVTSVYLIGYVCGPLAIAPLSELYGRNIMYNVCNIIFLIFTIACALANNLAALIIFRLLQGTAASCPMTLGAGTIADIIPVEKRGLAMIGWILGPLVGPTIGPLAGGYITQAKSWRWVFWVVSMIGGLVLIITFIFLRETYAYTILDNKTKKLRKSTGNASLRSALDTGREPKQLFMVAIVRPVKMLFLSPIVLLISLYVATVYGYLYLMFTTFPRIFEGQYGFSAGSVGLTYLGIGIGAFIALIFCGAVSDRLVQHLRNQNGGEHKPEYRLPIMIIGAIIIPIGLFMYGWTAEKKVQYMAPIVGTAFLGGGLVLVFMPASIYLVDAFTVYAASANAASTVLRSLVGALLPLAGNSMYNTLGVGWGTSLLGFIAVAFIPVPLLFYKFGERIRNGRFAKVQF